MIIQPELFVVTGPNATGKSSFIRSRYRLSKEAFDVIVNNIDFRKEKPL